MKKFKSSLVVTVIAIASLLIVVGCEKNEDYNEIGFDKCIFIEHHSHTNGELIDGNYKQGPQFDSPSFSYSDDTGILEGYISFEVNKSLRVVFGNGISRSGVAGTGVSTMLLGIYTMPFENDYIKITKIEADGTVHLMYNDSAIVLKSKEEWINLSSTIDTQNNEGEIAKANLITTDRFVNHGIIEKSNIKRQ